MGNTILVGGVKSEVPCKQNKKGSIDDSFCKVGSNKLDDILAVATMKNLIDRILISLGLVGGYAVLTAVFLWPPF